MTTPKRYVSWIENGKKHRVTMPGGLVDLDPHMLRSWLGWTPPPGWKMVSVSDYVMNVNTSAPTAYKSVDEGGEVRRRAAEEIHRLIQSRPRSPTIEEIEAILDTR